MDKKTENISPEVKSHSIALWLIAFALTVVLGILFNFWFYHTMRQTLEERLDNDAENCVSGMNNARINRFQGLNENKDPQYEAVSKQFAGIHDLFPRFAWMWLLKQRPDGTLYALAGAGEKEGKRNFCAYGEPFLKEVSAIQKVFGQRIQTNIWIPGEKGGRNFVVVTPIPNRQTGQVNVVLLAAMTGETFWETIDKETFPAFVLSLLMVIAVLCGTILAFVGIIGEKPMTYLPAYIFGSSGLLLTILLVIVFGQFDELHSLNEFIGLSSRVSNVRDSLMTVRDNEFHSMRNFLANEKTVDRETFSIMLEQVNRIPEIRYWNWIHAVPAEKRAAYETEIKEAFAKSSEIWQYDSEGKPARAPDRPLHYSLVSMTNPDTWQLFKAGKPGFDVLSLPAGTPLLEALADTEKTRFTSATGFLPPIEGTDIGWHQELALRVDDPMTGKLKGFIVGIFEPQHLLDISMGGTREQITTTTTDFVMVSPVTGSALVLASTDTHPHIFSYSPRNLISGHSHMIFPCVAFGKTYATITHPTPAFFTVNKHYGQLAAFLLGFPIFVLGTLLVYLFNRHHFTLEQLLTQQSETLVETEKRADELSKTGKSLSRRLNSITENVKDIVWEIDTDTQAFIYVTPNVEAIFGIPQARFLGKSPAEMGIFQDLTRFKRRFNAIVTRKENELAGLDEEETRAPDGRVIWLEISSSVNINPETGHMIWSGVSRVITDRKKREQYTRVIFNTLHVISENKGIARTIQAIAEIIRRLSGVDAVAIRLQNAGAFPYAASSGYSQEFLSADRAGKNTEDSATLSLEEKVFKKLLAHEPADGFSVTDSESYWTDRKQGADAFASRAFLPLFNTDNQMIGLIQIEDRTVGCFNANVIAQLEFIASHVGEYLIRKHLESDFRAIFQQMAESVLISEVMMDDKGEPCDLRFVYCNPAFSRLAHKPETEIIGHKLSEAFPYNLQSWLARLHESMVSDKPVQQAFFERRVNRYIEQTLFRIDKTQFACAITDVTERKLAERDLRDVMTFVSGGIFKYSAEQDDQFTFISQNMLAMLGYTEEEFRAKFKNRFSLMVYAEDRERVLNEINEQISYGDSDVCEYRIETKSGRLIWVYDVGHQVIDENGKRWFYVYISDITARKMAQQESEELRGQLAQATKMESIGRFAGGVAHDFNNMLQAILGFTEMGLMDAPEGSPVHEDMVSIQEAARRASDLTGQLLIFARRSRSTPQSVEVNASMEKLIALLRRLIGAEVALIWRPSEEPCHVWIEPGRLDQIVMNLCVNARDAMEDRKDGQIAVQCVLREFKQPFLTTTGNIPAGMYVVLSVQDNGNGISAENLSHIFEPFFTTKAKGKGTGLGLAIVYGIINEANGGILITSTEGKGTRFEIFLPRHEVAPQDVVPVAAPGACPQITMAPRKGLTILVVDDEISILSATRRMLESLGYAVLSSSSSREAVELFRANKDKVDLVLSDVIMPELRGPDMVAAMLKIKSSVPCLYMSGYTANLLPEQDAGRKINDFIAKPFTRSTLADKIAKAFA